MTEEGDVPGADVGCWTVVSCESLTCGCRGTLGVSDVLWVALENCTWSWDCGEGGGRCCRAGRQAMMLLGSV